MKTTVEEIHEASKSTIHKRLKEENDKYTQNL